MGNTFGFFLADFHGHGVEIYFDFGTALEVCENGFEGPTNDDPIVSSLWDQPQDWVQMGRAISGGWSSRIAGPFASTGALAAANRSGVAGTNSALAAASPELGRQENPGETLPRLSKARGAFCEDDRHLAATAEAEPSS